METIGQFIRRIRKQKGISQQELAEKTGILRQTLGFIELDSYKRVSMDKLQLIAKVLGINTNELLRLAGYPVEPPTNEELILKDLEEIRTKLDSIISRMRK